MNLSRNRIRSKAAQGGNAAIELALVLPILIVFLIFPIFYASVFWHYTVAEKAAKDAARYLSTISVQEMKSRQLAPAAAAIALEIAKTEIAELAPGSTIDDPVVQCGNTLCRGTTSGALPSTVHVLVKFDIYDTWFGVVDTGRYGWHIESDITMPYVGN
jgi:Flp pilus assembly protein TadG